MLNECAVRWRLGKAFQRLALFDALIQKYHGRALDLIDVYPTFLDVQKNCGDFRVLRKADATYYITTLKTFKRAIHRFLVGFTHEVKLQGPESAALADSGMQLAIHVLKDIIASPIWEYKQVRNSLLFDDMQEDSSLSALEDQISQEILESINERFKNINARLASQNGIRPIQKLILLVC